MQSILNEAANEPAENLGSNSLPCWTGDGKNSGKKTRRRRAAIFEGRNFKEVGVALGRAGRRGRRACEPARWKSCGKFSRNAA